MKPKVNSGIADQKGAGIGDEHQVSGKKGQQSCRREQITGVIGWKRKTGGTVADVLKFRQDVTGPGTLKGFLDNFMADEIIQSHEGGAGND